MTGEPACLPEYVKQDREQAGMTDTIHHRGYNNKLPVFFEFEISVYFSQAIATGVETKGFRWIDARYSN